jgi:prefoldin subunit 5
MTRLEELNEELQKLNKDLEALVNSSLDVVNDLQAEAELDYHINEINRVTTEISCLIN